MQLLINGLPAVLKPGTSFKLIRSNPYFEAEKGDFTFEVALTLSGCTENMNIFGPLHHPSVALSPQVGRRYDMTLIAPPIALRGYAEVKSLSQDEIKVQLVSGVPSFGFDETQGDRFIDELELGNAWDEFPPFESETGGPDNRTYTPGKSIEEMKDLFHDAPGIKNVKVLNIAQGMPTQTDCVVFPTHFESISPDMTTANRWVTEPAYHDRDTGYRFYMDRKSNSNLPDYASCRLCPQPYLLDIAVRIATAVGYKLDVNAYRTTPAQGLFVVNTREDIRRARALPHWTVRQFFRELSHLLGAVLVFEDNRVSLIPFKSYYNQGKDLHVLELVGSDFSTEMNKDPEGDSDSIAGSNIGYVFEQEDPTLILPDEVWEKAYPRIFTGLLDLEKYYETLTPEEKAASESLYGVNSGAGVIWYASLHRDDTGEFQLHRVNQMGPLIKREERTTDVELLMRPCKMFGHELAPVPYPDVAPPFSVDAAIRPDETTTAEEPTTDTQPVMELAHYDGRTLHVDPPFMNDWRPWPVGNPYQPDDVTGLMEWPKNVRRKDYPEDGVFALSTLQPDTLGRFHSSQIQTADTRVEYLFRIADPGVVDPAVPYHIAGKRYACHKLELTLTDEGITPLVEGYFYELS